VEATVGSRGHRDCPPAFGSGRLASVDCIRHRLHLVNRYYDPSTYQFLSIDPKVGTTLQPYAFVGGDPLNDTDPLGLQRGWWIRGSRVVKAGTRGARFLPGEGERHFVPKGYKGDRGDPEPRFVHTDHGHGFEDSKGNIWTEPRPKPSGDDGGPHWDVESNLGRGNVVHTNVAVDGNVIGPDRIPTSAGRGEKFVPTFEDPMSVDPSTGAYVPDDAQTNPLTGESQGVCEYLEEHGTDC
jgi:RHS repeat-associated protein